MIKICIIFWLAFVLSWCDSDRPIQTITPNVIVEQYVTDDTLATQDKVCIEPENPHGDWGGHDA